MIGTSNVRRGKVWRALCSADIGELEAYGKNNTSCAANRQAMDKFLNVIVVAGSLEGR